MQHPWLSQFVRVAVAFLLIAFVVRWVGRISKKRWFEDERGVLKHQRWVFFLGLAGTLFFYSIAILSNTWLRNSTTTIWSTLFFVGFGSLGLPFLADYFFARHRVNENGIDYGSMFGFRGWMGWSEVSRISFSPNMGWFVLHSDRGAKARISILVTGLREFARLVFEQVPREKIDRDAYLFLMQSVNAGTGVYVDPGSEEWRHALSKARESIPTLIALHGSTGASILVKYAITSRNGEVEHVWGELQRIDTSQFRATLETPLLSGDPVPELPCDLPLSAIEDWIVCLPDGSIRGGFTIQVEIGVADSRGLPLPDHIAAMEGRFVDA